MTDRRCVWCDEPLPSSAVSEFFCWAGCQELWYRQRNNNPLPDEGQPFRPYEYWTTVTANGIT